MWFILYRTNHYEENRKRCRRRRTLAHSQTQNYVLDKLMRGWSPEQISGRMKLESRSEFGHFEGDSVVYPHKQAINTLNELQTGLVAFTKLERKTAVLTAEAITHKLSAYDAKTLTLDNGSEFTNHEDVTKNIGVDIYFCDPYSSWQRGSNENINILLRGYLPKRASIVKLTQEELDDIAWELNNRPRKRLGYLTPLEFYQINVLNLNQEVCVAFDSRI